MRGSAAAGHAYLEAFWLVRAVLKSDPPPPFLLMKSYLVLSLHRGNVFIAAPERKPLYRKETKNHSLLADVFMTTAVLAHPFMP